MTSVCLSHYGRQDNKVIDKVLKGIQRQWPQQDFILEFSRQLFDQMPSVDLQQQSLRDHVGMASFIWEFFHGFSKRKVFDLAVFNPEVSTHGYQSKKTGILIVMQDHPFVVSSVRMALKRVNININYYLTIPEIFADRTDAKAPVFSMHADPAGGSESKASPYRQEMCFYIEVDQQVSNALPVIKNDLEEVLAGIVKAVKDWDPMMGRMQDVIDNITQCCPIKNEETAESVQFLQWLLKEFTFLGVRDYDYVEEDDKEKLILRRHSSLGVLSRYKGKPLAHYKAPPHQSSLSRFPASKHCIVVSKSGDMSTVHRSEYCDSIVVRRYGAQGKLLGERVFIGLITADIYKSSLFDIPLIRYKVKQVKAALLPSSTGFNCKRLFSILDTFQRDVLLQYSVDKLVLIAREMMNLQDKNDVRLFVEKDVYKRFIYVMICMPVEHYSTQLKAMLESLLLNKLKGLSIYSATPHISLVNTYRLNFTVRMDPAYSVRIQYQDIFDAIVSHMTPWHIKLADALKAVHTPAHAQQLYALYSHSFSHDYKLEYSPSDAVEDIDILHRLHDADVFEMAIDHEKNQSDELIKIKLYSNNHVIPIYEMMPLMKHFGCLIHSEKSYTVRVDSDLKYVSLLEISLEGITPEQFFGNKQLFCENFLAVYQQHGADDELNQLTFTASLSWRYIQLIRGLSDYLRQIGFSLSQGYMNTIFCRAHELVALLMQHFALKFDPQAVGEHPDDGAILEVDEARILEAFNAIENIDEDRLFRRIFHVISAVKRTNFYQDSAAHDVISLKIFSADIPDLQGMVPYFECYVFSRRFKGVHLRSGKISRGGLRWSDRPDDVRTEVLQLMQAQKIKNSIIVPTGAKGGFVILDNSSGQRCYQEFVHALLQLTDNMIGGEVVHPENTRIYDEDDTYLVVAADKGTATFSDYANAISKQQNYWLGDAFASGGSVGYDHKKMGVTARGAWESVKHHFRVLDIPINEDFTVVGIGDMSGDVFGNGMLLSENICLLAAFNGRHIFIDPQPDAAVSFKERQRLFALPQSQWTDYDPALISKGGGVYSRSSRVIKLSPQACKMLGMEKNQCDPDSLIRAILSLPVDLLWNGGIGTYVRASTETDDIVCDKFNDGVRIAATDLKARVVGEGGNLGLTQRARIEYAVHGGAINTDSVDNAAGVSCSDQEVNIKILLNNLYQAGDINYEERNVLLMSMQDEIGELVTRDIARLNYLISCQLHIANEMPLFIDDHVQCLQSLGYLDMQFEALPSSDCVRQRPEHSKYTRPELALIIAHSKMALRNHILGSSIFDDPAFDALLLSAFPAQVVDRFPQAILTHNLKKHIIAKELSNMMMLELGFGFVRALQTDLALPIDLIVKCFMVIRQIFAIDDVHRTIAVQSRKCSVHTMIPLILEYRNMLRYGMQWLILHHPQSDDMASFSVYATEKIQRIREDFHKYLYGNSLECYQRTLEQLLACGASSQVAGTLSAGRLLHQMLNIVEILKTLPDEQSMLFLTEFYFHVEDKLELTHLVAMLDQIAYSDPMAHKASAILIMQLNQLKQQLVCRLHHLLSLKHAGTFTIKHLNHWLDHQGIIGDFRQRLFDIQHQMRDKLSYEDFIVIIDLMNRIVAVINDHIEQQR